MVAIVSGSNLGLNLTSLATLGQQGVFGAPTQGSNGERVYVNAATGNLVLQSRDDVLVSRGNDAVALRTYNSLGLLTDDSGDNWSSGFWLQPLILVGTLNGAGSTLQRTDRDGSVAFYAYDAAAGLYRTTEGEGAYDTLTYVSTASQLEWRDGTTGNSERYEASGAFRLLSSRDASGNTLAYTYNAAGRLCTVVTASGDTTFYDYIGNNLVQIRTVTSGGAGNTDIRYAYDTSNRLATVTVDLTPGDNAIADGKVFTTNYTYEGTSARVTRVAQSDGSSLTFTYVAGTGKVASVADGLGQVTTFTYGTNSLQVRDPLGLLTTYTFDAGGRLTQVATPIATTVFAYNTAGDVLSVRDGELHSTSYQYDANGNQVLQRDAAGNTVIRTFDSRNQLLTETVYAAADPDGAGTAQPGSPMTSRYVYDAGGRNLLRFAVSAEGHVTEHRYDGAGQRNSTLVYGGATYAVAALAPTLALTETDLAGWVGTQSPASIQRQDMTYDARGSLESLTRYARLDAAGAGILDGTQSREAYVYDQTGQLLQTVSPTGAATAYSYDGLGRVLTATDALGRMTTTAYSDVSIRTVTWLANGRILNTQYDATGRLVSTSDLTPASVVFGETRYFRDAAGRLRMTQDPTGVRSWILYDTAGRKVADIDGDGTVTEYQYNKNDQLLHRIRYAVRANTALLVDAAGSPILSATLAGVRPPADAGDVRYWRSYDLANRVFREAQTVGTGSDGTATVAVTENRYDGASRVTSVIRYATTSGLPTTLGQIDLPMYLTAQDRTTRSLYDADGLLLGTLDAEGYLATFAYDAAGRLAERIAYATLTDPMLRGAATVAQLRPAASAADIRTVFLYDGKGQLAAEVDGEGYLTETVRDAAGNVTQTVRYANRVLQPVSVSSSIASIRPAASPFDRSTLRSYDSLNRLLQETSPEGVVKQYGYDSTGNLVSTTLGAGTTEVRTLLARYDLQGRLTGELSAEGAALLTGGQTQAQIDGIWTQYGMAHAYDSAGRRVASTDALGNRTLFFYNEDGDVTHVVNALGEVREKRYDAHGRITDDIAYATRIATAGLAGGLVPSSLKAALAAIANTALDTRVSYTYTRDNRIASGTDALGNVTTYKYTAFGEEASVVQAVGSGVNLVETYSVDHRGLRIQTFLDNTAPPGYPPTFYASTSTVYDAFGRATRTVDANGDARDRVFDRLGRVVTVRDPLGSAVNTGYDAFGRVLTQTDALGSATTYAYDAAARTTTVTTPEGVRTVTSYSRHGQVLSLADGKGNVTSYAYDRNGNLLRTTTPLTSTSSTYDAASRLIETIDATGVRTAYSYDAANRVLTRRLDPAGLNLATSYQYDAKGQRVAMTDPNGVVTATEYDRKGQTVKQTIDPSGLNLQTVYTYDARGNTLSVLTPGGTLTQYTFDKFGRRTQERTDPNGLNLTRSWTYDKAGNVSASTDAAGNKTRYFYDAADRLAITVDAQGGAQQNSYDAAGRVTRTTRYALPIPSWQLANLGSLSSAQAALTSQPSLDEVEHRVYDRDGRLAATVNGAGAVVRYSYDANGNVVSRVAFANAITLEAWATGTVPAPAANAARDEQWRTVYDALNRAIYTLDGAGGVVRQSYDGNSRVLQRTAYATAVPTATAPTQAALDAAVALVANPARDVSVRNVYDAAGRLAWSVDGMGAVTQRSYDRNGNLVRQLAYATALASGANPATVVASSADRSTAMVYDAANRLVFQVDAVNAVTEQAYDGNGKVVRRTAYAAPIGALPPLGVPGTLGTVRAAVVSNPTLDRSTTYAYDAAGRQSIAVNALGGAVETTYDGAGRVIATTAYASSVANVPASPTLAALKALLVASPVIDRITRYAYDAAGRPAIVVDAAGAAVETTYDGIGRATASTAYANPVTPSLPLATTLAAVKAAIPASSTTDRTTRFAYDAAGRVVFTVDPLWAVRAAQYDALGRVTRTTRYFTAIAPGTSTTAAALATAVAGVANTSLDQVEQSAYDAAGRQVSHTDALGANESHGFDAVGNKVSFGNKNGSIWTYTYDAAGRMLSETSPLVKLATVALSGGTLVAGPLADGAVVTRMAYDAFGDLRSRTEAAGRAGEERTTRYDYDGLGRQVHVSYPTLDIYNAAADAAAANGATGVAVRVELTLTPESRTFYDTLGNAVASIDVAGALSQKAYDRLGRVAYDIDALGYVTGYTRNAFGEVTGLVRYGAATSLSGVVVTSAGQASTKAQVDAAVTAPGFNHASDRTVATTYDRAGRATEALEPLAYVSELDANGVRISGTVARTTRKVYNAFGELLEERSLRNAAGAWATVTHYYDQAGRETATIDPLGYLTKRKFDSRGNLVSLTEFANTVAPGWTTASYVAPVASGDDRTTDCGYDRLDRKVSEDRKQVEYSTSTSAASIRGSVVTTYGYDALGNQTRTTDATGGVTSTFYDVLGRVVAIVAPARTVTSDSGTTVSAAPLTVFRRDAHGNVLVKTEFANGAPAGMGTQAPEGVASGADRTTLTRFDSSGHALQARNAELADEFFSYDVQGRVAKKWQGVTGNDGITRTLFEIDRYDKLGQLEEIQAPASTSVYQGNGVIATLSQATAGVVRTQMVYNAFGEMTRRGINGGQEEFFDYDTAGRLWRTNSGDGVARIQLYDGQGHITAEIRSAGAGNGDVNINGFLNAAAADDNPQTRRVDTRYDAAGHVLATWQPVRQQLQASMVTVQRQYTAATVTQSAQPYYGESQWPVSVTGRNEVVLGWNSLAALGSGDVKVRVDYRTPTHVVASNDSGVPVTYWGGLERSYTSGVFTAEQAATGVTLNWAETLIADDTGIGSVSRIVVYKKDVYGAWQAVIEQVPGYGANELDLASPPEAGAGVVLELRNAGTAGDVGWLTAGILNYGDRFRFDASSLSLGVYEYRVKIAPPGQATRVAATGTVALTQPPLNSIATPITYGGAGTGILAWQSPGATTGQVLRYRAAGSTGAWSSLAVTARTSVLDGVDTRSLAPGTYQFELLWTAPGQNLPTSHATGTFNLTAPQAAYWVPPINLPPITGLRIGSSVVGGVSVPTIEWSAANANLAQYTSNGTWYSLAIDNSGQYFDEAGVASGTQRVLLNGLAANNYSLRVYSGSPSPTKQATASFTVYAQSAGYYQTVYVNVPVYTPIIAYYAPVYETRYATRTVAYQVWVNDPPVIVGYDENGQPIYSYPGHYETRYTTETYSYQVQVGQTPVYARDENGNILYSTSYVQQAQQVWVAGTTPTPTLAVTTPPYTPGYTVAAVPTQYSASVTTVPGSTAISTTEGALVSQNAAVNSDNQWLRPLVLRKSDRWGNILEITDPRSAYWKTTYRYNASNQLVEQTLPDDAGNASGSSPVTSLFYDVLGRQVALRDANGNVNGQVFDAGGNLVQEVHADTGVVTYGYSVFGDKVRTRSAEGRTLTATFDRMGRQTSVAKGVEEVYQINNRAVVLVDTRNLTERWTYDQLGRKLTQSNGHGDVTRYAYDAGGNVLSTQQPMGQVMKAAFDAQGRKVAEVDALGNAATWSYNYFGQLVSHVDLGGASYSYSYDNARQLTSQASTRAGQVIGYSYDAAGQVTGITDSATGKATTYMYDLSGRRVRERTVQAGVTYQDNHLAYDPRGNLRDVADARVHLAMEYDKVGNRTRIATYVDYQGVAGEASSNTDRYFRYDAMNRQTVVDAVDAAGNIGQQGHKIAYDRDGNRISDTAWGNRVVPAGGQTIIMGYNGADDTAIYGTLPVTFVRDTGLSTEQYRYDTLNRLTSVVRDGVQIDVRFYDGADRVVQSGPAAALPSSNYGDLINEGVAPGEVNGKERRQNRYDANGRLLYQSVQTHDGREKYNVIWDPNPAAAVLEKGITYAAGGYDAAGNVTSYVVQNVEAGVVNKFTNGNVRYEGYQVGTTSGVSSKFSPGTTTQQYDANGFLTSVADSTQPANDRTFVNDAAGRALFVNQGGNVQRQLIVNGEVLGLYGAGVNPLATGSNPTFANLVDFDFGYARISASYPTPSPGAYTVRIGDTLQSIAQGAYGDSSLWYRIAEANGLGSSKDLKVGTTLNVPNRVSTVSNNNGTFKPYDPSRIEGDKTPNLPMPKNDAGCGGIGKVLMVVVAVLVSVFVGPGLLAAVLSSLASQAVGLATGAIDKFSWKSVALSVVSQGAAAGMSGAFQGLGSFAPIAQAAAANVVTQGVAVATGLQKKFDWRGVAASAVGTGIAQEVGPSFAKAFGGTAGGAFAARVATSLVSGGVAALMRGGRYAVQQVAIDAFGNALGQSLASASSSAPAAQADPLGDFINEKLAEQGRRDRYGFGSVASEPGLKASVQDWDNALSRGLVAQQAPISSDAWKQQQVTQLVRAGKFGDAADVYASDVRMTDAGLWSPEQGLLPQSEGDYTIAKGPGLPEALKRLPQMPVEAPAPELPSIGQGLLRKAGAAGLWFYMAEPPTTKWQAAGASFSYNQDDFTLRIKDSETGTGLAVPGIHNPSQYSDAQYLAYVTYKANGGQLNINDYVSVGAPDSVGLSITKARGFDVTDAVTVSGRRAIDLGKSYEAGVRALYGNEVSYEDRSYRTIVNGKLVDGVADHVIVRGGQQIAVEAKFVEDWNTSLRNPGGSSGSYPWSVRAQQDMLNQASKYSSFFDGGVIYHTNSPELAAHYTNLFEKLGVQNFRFVITPAVRK